MTKVKLIVPVFALAILSAAILTATQTFAQETAQPVMLHHSIGNSSLVQKLAERFNLNQADVQAVFDEVHAARFAEMETRYQEKLDAAVENGELTEAQKELILDKREEMAAKAADKIAEHDELKIWADEHGIDPKYLMFHMVFKGERAGMHEMKDVMFEVATPAN